MIHCYQMNGYNIILDVHSGGVHVVDELFYRLAQEIEPPLPEACPPALTEKYAAYGKDAVEEVYAAREILKAAGVRREGPELVSCPTCGRTKIDLIALANEVEGRLKLVDKPITVAVMGCAVNGPGEAAAADCGIAGGVGEGLLFQKGEIVKKVPQERLVDELFALIETL